MKLAAIIMTKAYFFLTIFVLLLCSCSATPTDVGSAGKSGSAPAVKDGHIDLAYPVGKTEYVTQARDSKDEWFNAQDFGENNHLGEDWNKNSGGNTDCGEPVYAIGDGTITYAADAGPGWGNVIIVTHTLSNGSKIQSLYGHLKEMSKTGGEVKKREKIGTIGNANGRYLCHLHFEIRKDDCPSWDLVFLGYSMVRNGWVDPSDFIDAQRSKN